MQFVLTIDCDGAAFTRVTNDETNGDPQPVPEVVAMLKQAATKIEDGREGDVLRDTNGNVCGSFRFTEED